ncbi:MAG: hypothetical protein LH467_15225 [Gemmatimonadaceae bacterium]|nr:hypothetical protein [Gemmatimonadaceae bacterium]
MRVVFTPANDFGVVDHVISPLDGSTPSVDIPLRVVPNGDDGSEVMLTLFQQTGMTDDQYAADAVLVLAVTVCGCRPEAPVDAVPLCDHDAHLEPTRCVTADDVPY